MTHEVIPYTANSKSSECRSILHEAIWAEMSCDLDPRWFESCPGVFSFYNFLRVTDQAEIFFLYDI